METKRQVVLGGFIIPRICKLFGIPWEGLRIFSIEISLQPNQPGIIIVKHFTTIDEDEVVEQEYEVSKVIK